MKKEPSRKETRKRARQDKKQRKRTHFIQRQSKDNTFTINKKSSGGNQEFKAHEQSKRKRLEEDEVDSDDLGENVENDIESEEEVVKAPKKSKKVASEPTEDDLEIARLEQKLGITKKKKGKDTWKHLEKGLLADGFDNDLLDFLKDSDRFLKDSAQNDKDEETNASDGEDGEIDDDEPEQEDLDAAADEDDSPPIDSQQNPKREQLKTKPASVQKFQQPVEQEEDDEDEDDDEVEDDRAVRREEIDPLSDAPTMFLPSKNIYGDRDGEDDDEERSVPKVVDRALESKVRGLLNRLSEENASRILKDLLALYDSNAPRAVQDSLGRTILEGASPATSLLFASMAFAIETNRPNLVSFLIENIVASVDKGDVSSVTLMLLGHFSALGACASELLFDVCERLSSESSPSAEGWFTAIVQSCGWKMRATDPTRFRNVFLSVATSTDSQRLDSYARSKVDFSIEEEKVRKWRRWVSKECKEGTIIPQPLNVPLQDFVNAAKNGRWWVLGASWSNNGQELTSKGSSVVRSSKGNPIAAMLSTTSKDVLRVAVTQGMNTELQKAIFCAIMSGDDYIHAFDSIVRLSLNDQGEREAVRIIMKCCIRSKRYNPFFALLASRLCSFHPRFRFSFQLAIWDDIKALESSTETNQTRIVNLARFVAELILRFSLSISVLKVIDFVKITSKPKLWFLRDLFLALLIPFDEKDSDSTREGDLLVAKVFSRMRAAQDATLVRDGVLVFWSRTEPFMNLTKTKNPLLYKRLRIARNVIEHYVKSEDERAEEDGF